MFLNSFFKSAFAIYIFSSLHHCAGQRDRRQSLALCGGDQTVYSTPLYITSMDCLFRAAGRSRRVAILRWPGSRRGGRCWTTPWCWESPAHADTTPAAAVPPLATAHWASHQHLGTVNPFRQKNLWSPGHTAILVLPESWGARWGFAFADFVGKPFSSVLFASFASVKLWH